MNNTAYEHTAYLTERCGIRVAGTFGAMKASEYMADVMEKSGLDIERHVSKTPICNVRHSELKCKISGKWVDIPHTPALFSGQTPKEGITLPLVYVENGCVAALEANDIQGKAVLVCRDVYQDYPDVETYKLLHEYGVAMVIYTTSDGHKDIPYVYANYESMDEAYTIPTAIVHYDTAVELVKNTNTEIRYSVQFDITEGESMNVIGTLEGDGSTDECIVVCGHIDSAYGSVGATDDAAAIGIIMTLADYYSKQNQKHKRSIKFIGWSGHECGLHGSKNFLLSHPDTYKNVRFVLNYDIVGNAVASYMIAGGYSDEVCAQLQRIIDAMKIGWPLNIAPLVCDTLNFAAAQIPQITVTAGCFSGNHTRYDNLDLIHASGMETPIDFSINVIDWAADADNIQQGYSYEVNEMMKATGIRYNWGLFK